MPSEAPSLHSLQLLQGSASATSLPISEIDDDAGNHGYGVCVCVGKGTEGAMCVVALYVAYICLCV